MSQPTDSLDAVDLKALVAGGVIREEVLDKVFGKENRETPFLDSIGTGSFDNNYSEWVEDSLLTANVSNKYSSGTSYAPSTAAHGKRVGNHAQISRTGVNITDRAEALDSIGQMATMAEETQRSLKQLRIDQEAIATGRQASVADNPGSTVGTTAGFDAWLTTNTSNGATAGADGGFNTSTKVVDAPTAGDKRAFTWTMLTDQIENCFVIGAKPNKLITVPQLTKRIGNFLIETKKVQYTANISGVSPETLVSNQYVDSFRTDFGYTMSIEPNLWQPTYTAGDTGTVATVFGVDPEFVQKASLYGTRVKTLSTDGDFERKMVQEDWMTKVTLERAHFAIRDIIPTSAVTA